MSFKFLFWTKSVPISLDFEIKFLLNLKYRYFLTIFSAIFASFIRIRILNADKDARGNADSGSGSTSLICCPVHLSHDYAQVIVINSANLPDLLKKVRRTGRRKPWRTTGRTRGNTSTPERRVVASDVEPNTLCLEPDSEFCSGFGSDSKPFHMVTLSIFGKKQRKFCLKRFFLWKNLFHN